MPIQNLKSTVPFTLLCEIVQCIEKREKYSSMDLPSETQSIISLPFYKSSFEQPSASTINLMNVDLLGLLPVVRQDQRISVD